MAFVFTSRSFCVYDTEELGSVVFQKVSIRSLNRTLQGLSQRATVRRGSLTDHENHYKQVNEITFRPQMDSDTLLDPSTIVLEMQRENRHYSIQKMISTI